MQVPSKLDLFSELRCKYTLNPDSHTKKVPAISIWGTRVELRYLSGQQLFEAYAFNRNQMWHVVIRVTTPEWQTPGVAAGNTCEVLSFLWHEKDIRWATVGKSAVTAILHSRLILTLSPCRLKQVHPSPMSKKHQPCCTMVRRGWPLFDRKASGFTVVSLLVDIPRVEKGNSVRGSCRKHVGSREC